jgi:hypothetical protein
MKTELPKLSHFAVGSWRSRYCDTLENAMDNRHELGATLSVRPYMAFINGEYESCETQSEYDERSDDYLRDMDQYSIFPDCEEDNRALNELMEVVKARAKTRG